MVLQGCNKGKVPIGMVKLVSDNRNIFKCSFCEYWTLIPTRELTRRDSGIIKKHLARDHGWISEKEIAELV